MHKKPFVLSGGGARGFAHLGVVKALQEHNIFPSAIAGTSAGSIAGAFLANGFTPDEIRELFISKFKLTMLAWNSFKMGLVSMKKIRAFLQQNLRYTRFEDLPIPLYVTATNFQDGRQHIFHQGNLIDAIVAASSIPVIFPPVFIQDIPYVDGGLSNNLPIEPFLAHKKDIIAIYVNPIRPFTEKENVFDIMDRAFHLNFREKVNQSAADCHLYIEPPELGQFGLFDIQKLPEIFEVGYTYAKNLLVTG